MTTADASSVALLDLSAPPPDPGAGWNQAFDTDTDTEAAHRQRPPVPQRLRHDYVTTTAPGMATEAPWRDQGGVTESEGFVVVYQAGRLLVAWRLPRQASTPQLAWFGETLSRLHEIGQLGEDWDGCGSRGTDRAVLLAAEDLACRVAPMVDKGLPAPFVCPIAGGTLQFEWTRGRRHIEVEFVDESQLAVLKEDTSDSGATMESEEFPASRIDRVTELLGWLVAS